MVIIVSGLPGTGKTYFSEHLATETGAKHLNTDKTREKHNKKGQYDEETKAFIYNELKKEMIELLQQRKRVIIDGTFYKKQKRKEFKEVANKFTSDIYMIRLKASEEVVKARLSKSRKYSEAGFGVYQKIKQKFESMETPHLVLWSNNKNLSELIKQTKLYIDE